MPTAFIAVDVQNDFCEGGSLAVAGGSAVARAISQHVAATDYDLIVATRDYHVDPGEHFSDEPDFVDSWPPHCVVDTAGASFHPALDVTHLQVVVSKGAHDAAYSGFEGSTDSDRTLVEVLRAADVNRVVIGGLATDHCVRATALDAIDHGFDTYVDLRLSAGVAPDTTDAAVRAMRDAGVTVLTA